MTHSDAGHYAAKHGTEAHPDRRIAEALADEKRAGSCPCARAERAAAELGVSLAEVGRTLDLLEVRIGRCQLGLFGYPDSGQPNGRIVAPAGAVDEVLEAAIREALEAGRLPCRNAWAIAERLGIPRMALSAACETLGVRIKPCQLGAF